MADARPDRCAYDPDLAEAVLDALRGGLTIAQACEGPGRPRVNDVMRWTHEEPGCSHALGLAVRDSALIRAERIAVRAEGHDAPEALKPKTPAEAAVRDRLAFTANRFLLSLYDPFWGQRFRFEPKGAWTAPRPPSAARRLDGVMQQIRALTPPCDPAEASDDDEAETTALEAEELRADAAKLGLDKRDMALIGLTDEQMALAAAYAPLHAKGPPAAAALNTAKEDDVLPSSGRAEHRLPRRARRFLAAKARHAPRDTAPPPI